MKKIAITLLLPVATSLAACNHISKSIDDTLHGKPRISAEDRFFRSSADDEETNLVTDVAELQKAETSLRQLPEFKGKPIRIFSDLYIYGDGRITLQIQDPDTLQNVNEYNYSTGNRQWTSAPVNLSAATANDLSNQTILLDSVRFTTAARIAAVFAQKAKSVGSSSALHDVYYIPGSGQWYCDDIKSARATYKIYFNAAGTVKSFSRE